MPTPLTEKEVNRLYQLLNKEQRELLEQYLKQSKKSKWIEKLAHKKGVILRSDMSMNEIWDILNDWELKEVLNGGYSQRPYRCECGMPLRFCYIVHHRKENKTYRLGVTCLGNYTMLYPELIKDITNGFHKVDLERDEILKRYENGWDLTEDYIELALSEQIQKQIDVGLPLSDNQIHKTEHQFKDELRRIRYKYELERMAQYRKESIKSLSHSEYQGVSPTRRSSINEYLITYDQILFKHLGQLKQTRENEHKIVNSSIKTQWSTVQNSVKSLKHGEEINYSDFLSRMLARCII
ncbi:hypothetical protein [Paenibacillus tepidiphilus]|uniref:hypothetical protein n=1 Tax=Paenibacillus tepidiphilus TaxID=2608683 RepID=UPI0012391CFF|nr:hypothetical protein [Paenibacillus tepidiphilus]